MTTATYQPNPSAGIDTYVSLDGEINYGTVYYTSLNTNSRVLIKFDVSDISSDSICSSATMSLYTYAGDGTGDTWTAYPILPANGDWTETGATWTTKNGIDSWAGSSGCSTSGTDYSATPIGSCVMNETFVSQNQFSLTPSVVKTWFGSSNQNYGMVIRTDATLNTLFTYSSDETTNTAQRPKLVVVYSLSGVVYRRTFQPMGMRSGSRRPA